MQIIKNCAFVKNFEKFRKNLEKPSLASKSYTNV